MKFTNPTIDGLAGHQMVSSTQLPLRRLSPAQLARMLPEDRILYERHHPRTDAELYDALQHEQDAIDYQLGDEVVWGSSLHNDGPDDYLDDVDDH